MVSDPNEGRVRSPAPRPCASCPYRRDVPAGVWAAEEYAKLPAYDRDTTSQPAALFLCHQNERASEQARICSGWVGCHGEELLALRLAVICGAIDDATFVACLDYVSPVALFATGGDAAAHGVSGIAEPDAAARAAIAKIERRRPDLTL